ncbi:MAG TPA: hypothetical protein VNL14_02995 [Candidatus Acidoferrales bacterium]|nr:hypothetical protein [Candidatus Acidoferrales bacterium]
MEVVKATLWIYRLALGRAGSIIRGNPAVLLAPLAYGVLLSAAGVLVLPLGLIGRMLFLLVADACMSSGLYLVENLLQRGKTDLKDFVKGWGVYIWDIIQVSFILWVPLTIASQILYTVPNGLLMLLLLRILVYTIFNVVPELIYQARLGALEVLSASYSFVIENWLEWFIPNLLIGIGVYLAFEPLLAFASLWPAALQLFVVVTIGSAFLACFMVFRGVLFSMLQGSTRRSRVYKFKVGEPPQGSSW